jgi:hypothetical protein
MNETPIQTEKSLKEIGIEAMQLASKINLDMILPLLGEKLEREALLKYRDNQDIAVIPQRLCVGVRPRPMVFARQLVILLMQLSFLSRIHRPPLHIASQSC